MLSKNISLHSIPSTAFHQLHVDGAHVACCKPTRFLTTGYTVWVLVTRNCAGFQWCMHAELSPVSDGTHSP